MFSFPKRPPRLSFGTSRLLSTHGLDPYLRDCAVSLSRKLPTFSVSPKNVAILSQPQDFYSRILGIIRRSKQRIFLSSLYIGSSETELIDELGQALTRSPSLKCYIQLDLNRSTRQSKPWNTAELLLPLLRQFPDRVQVSMFRSPYLRGLLASVVPPRFKEGWGTWHAKVYGGDDEVMISGANLNASYFRDRQDRYVYFSSSPTIAQYCFDFMRTASSLSFKLLPSPSPPSVTPESITIESYSLVWPPDLPHPHHVDRVSAFQDFHEKYKSKITHDDHSKPSDVVIFPVIQAGQFGVKEEEESLTAIIQAVNTAAEKSHFRPLIHFTSGYFSFNEQYQKMVLDSNSLDWRILAASPKANGFYGSKGLSGRIPEGYTWLEQKFMKSVGQSNLNWDGSDSGSGINLSEWARPGWTYHAKGIWLSKSRAERPIMTVFGSTNFNSRSSFLDTELSFIMMLPSTPASSSEDSTILQKKLQEEVDSLRQYAIPWQGAKRDVSFITKMLVKLVGKML